MGNGINPTATRNRASKNKVNAELAKKEALKHRAAGLNYRQIAEVTGVSPATAMKRVHSAMAELKRDNLAEAELLVTLELERLDNMLNGLWPAAFAGDCAAVDRVLRIMERRAKLLGLDAPAKAVIENTDGGMATIEELNRMFNKAMAESQKKREEVERERGGVFSEKLTQEE